MINDDDDRPATLEDVRELLDVAPMSDALAAEIARRMIDEPKAAK